jgi:hypothetical protein
MIEKELDGVIILQEHILERSGNSKANVIIKARLNYLTDNC